MMLQWLLVVLTVGAFSTACTNKPVRKAKSRPAATPQQPFDPVQPDATTQPAQPNQPEAQVPAVADPSDCVALPNGQTTTPFFLPAHGIMVTRVLKTCTTDDGRPGYAADTAWMAMGFPCTAGQGRLEWKPNYYAPKIVTFSVSTDCPTAPATTEEVIKIGRSILGLSEMARLMAYTPMAVQYYEIDEYSEMNTGSVIEFREAASLDKGWTNFKNNVPTRVRLYGRENVWGEGDQLYMFEADLIQATKSTFKLSLVSARGLTAAETAALKTKCDALRPRRNCRELFAN